MSGDDVGLRIRVEKSLREKFAKPAARMIIQPRKTSANLCGGMSRHTNKKNKAGIEVHPSGGSDHR